MQTKDPALTKTPIDGEHIHNAKTHEAMADSIVASTRGTHHHDVDNDRIHNDGIHNAKTYNTMADSIVASTRGMHHYDNTPKSTETFQETVIGTRYVSHDSEHGDHMHEGIHHNSHNVMSTDDSINNHTTVNKGTETFQEGVIESEHVNPGDNPARQPDRRDQQGNAFDDGINEHNVGSEEPKSHAINDINRYANTDNAQTRVLNPDEKDE